MQESAIAFPTVLFCYSSGPCLELLLHPSSYSYTYFPTLPLLFSHSYSYSLENQYNSLEIIFLSLLFFPPLVSNPSYSWSCSYTCIAHSLLPMALRLFSYEYTRVLLYSYSRSLVIFSRSYSSKSILEWSFSSLSLERIKQLR